MSRFTVSSFQPRRVRHSSHEMPSSSDLEQKESCLLGRSNTPAPPVTSFYLADSTFLNIESKAEDEPVVVSSASRDNSIDMGQCWLVDSQQTTQTSVLGKGWMDQISEVNEMKDSTMETNKKNNTSHKNGHLQAPGVQERRSRTRDRSPQGNNGNVVLVVPKKLSKRWKERGDNAILATVSALYAKFLVVIGLAFPMTEVISNHVTTSSYLMFYLYLYFGSLLYFFYVFISLVCHRAKKDGICCANKHGERNKAADDFPSGDEAGIRLNRNNSGSHQHHHHHAPTHHGSFYLRIGAVAFGIGSMIYSALEFAQYFEIDSTSECDNVLFAVTPASRMMFTFIQMYFIFLNSKMANCKHKAVVYFGLMHSVATNLCVWLNVIIEETKHEILHFLHPNSSNHIHESLTWNGTSTTLKYEAADEEDLPSAEALVDATQLHQQISQELLGNSMLDECKRSELVGNLVQNVSPLLFPCAIEYSLICAAILYVMWKNIATGDDKDKKGSSNSSAIARRSRHHYSVDCGKANKGLFSGIFVLVLTIISLIMFFALINHPAYTRMAIMEVGMVRLLLYCLTFGATIIGITQVRELRYDSSRHFDLDDVLLIVGQLGLMAYTIFTIIASYYTAVDGNDNEDGSLMALIGALAALVQGVTQTLFILDASRRNTYSADQQIRKPGREVVTFLLVANFAMWTAKTLEKSRAEVNPVQLNFYGLWPWIIITNVSMPLAIFYRFHSTVVLCEIWKRCYKRRETA